jgi:hypothetical protein
MLVKISAMGGFSNGLNQRPSQYGRVDSTWSLDVMALHRAGWLKPGQWGTYCPGLNLLAKEGKLALMYDATFEDGTKRPIGETYDVVNSPRHFGGSIPYFICPGIGCGRRVSKLYGNSGHFRCRQCSRLVYNCQYEGFVECAARQIDKIATKLESGNEFGGRPKYMRRKTYEKLLARLHIIEDRLGI